MKTIAKAVSGLAFKGAISYAGGPVGKVGLLLLAKDGVEEVR